MTNPVRIWICAAYSPVYRCGGWAAVWAGQGPTMGAAGGERATTAPRLALLGLAAALRDLAKHPTASGLISIETTSSELADCAPFLTSFGEVSPAGRPEEDLDLWAQIAASAKGRRLRLVHRALKAGTPIAFASAWADLGLEKAKASGNFAAAIPKPNLAKIPGLA